MCQDWYNLSTTADTLALCHSATELTLPGLAADQSSCTDINISIIIIIIITRSHRPIHYKYLDATAKNTATDLFKRFTYKNGGMFTNRAEQSHDQAQQPITSLHVCR